MSFLPELGSDYAARAAAVGLHAEHVSENFIVGSGHGGQNRNKRSTTVQLVHHPTDTEVRSGGQRQQHQNRIAAWMNLLEKLEERKRDIERALEERDYVQKAQKRKRTRGGKENVLREKKERGKIKQDRQSIS